MITIDNLDDLLKHYGVKGMKWGVRRFQPYPKGSKNKGKFVGEKGTIRKHLDSLKRERQWSKVLGEVNKLTSKEINTVTKRVNLENDMKRLSRKKGVGSKKDKEDYLRREKMSDSELNRKVTRLRAKDGLNSAVKNASKEQREFGEKVTEVAKSVGTNYALSKVTGKPMSSMSSKEIYNMVTNPKESSKGSGTNLKEDIFKKIDSRRGIK